MADVGAFTPQDAAEVLQIVRRLKASGLLDRGLPIDTSSVKSPPVWIKNISPYNIPAFACLQVFGSVAYGDRTYLEVNLPEDKTGKAGPYVFNGPNRIPIGKTGVAQPGPHVRALSDGTPITAGMPVAPIVNNFSVSSATFLNYQVGMFVGIGPDSVQNRVVRLSTIVPFRHYQFTITQGLVTGEGKATIRQMDGSAYLENATIRAGMSAFEELTVGDSGQCFYQDGLFWINNANCPA